MMQVFQVAIAAAVFLSGAANAGSREVPEDEAYAVISEGRIISTSPVGPDALGTTVIGEDYPPSLRRMHEAFILHERSLYVCYLSATVMAATTAPPTFTCYGNK